jgi:parvulin-like peptidyl-prolyl isomerase
MRILKGLLITSVAGLCGSGLLPAGCVDQQGNRITLQQWVSSRENGPRQTGSSKNRGNENSEADLRKTAPPDTGDQEKPEAPRPEARKRVEAAATPLPDETGPSVSAVRSDALLVNGETITVNDILEPISPQLEKLCDELPPPTYLSRAAELIRQQIIEMVAEHLIWRKAKQMLNEDMEKSLKKSVDKMEKDRINREFQGRETMYDKYLAKHGKTRDEVRERLRRSIVIDSYLRERLLPLVPNPRKQELLSYYKANSAEFSQSGKREMFLIDVPVAAFLEPRRRVSEADVARATEEAKSSIQGAAEALGVGQPFEEVAKRYSRGPNAEQGGAWGFIERPLQGRWEVPSKRLFEMKEGETSEVLESAKGFFIIKAGKIEEGKVISFDEAQPQIAYTLRQRRFGKLRAQFLQDELRLSTIGSLDEFVMEVTRAMPKPKSMAQ